MPVRELKKFLESNGVRYVQISHSPAYTAQELAETTHIRGKELAKTIVVKLDGKMTLAILPASYKIEFNRLREVTGADDVELASEPEFKDLFPDCDAGAMPPFGNLYAMDVLVDSVLSEDDEIAFNAGTYTELIRISYADFAKLVNPEVATFSVIRD